MILFVWLIEFLIWCAVAALIISVLFAWATIWVIFFVGAFAWCVLTDRERSMLVPPPPKPQAFYSNRR